MKQNRPILALSSVFCTLLINTSLVENRPNRTENSSSSELVWNGAKAVAVEITAPSSGTLKTNSHTQSETESQRQTHAGKECVKREREGMRMRENGS